MFGPLGSTKNVVPKDDDLVSEVATYANQTEDLEDTIEALAAVEDS